MVTNENLRLIKQLQLQLADVLKSFNKLKEENAKLNLRYQQILVEKQSSILECETLREQLKTVNLAQTMSGKSDQDNRQIKLQINSYIKEIDRCLAILNKD
jgi:hypothetical protein